MNSHSAWAASTQAFADDANLWASRAAAADAGAREQIILRYVPLVHSIVGRLGISGGEYDDLVGQGMLGLIHAVDRYDPSRGVRFTTFATHHIQGRVLDAMRRLDPLSRSARRRVRRLEAAAGDLHHRLGRAPADAELAERAGLALEDVRRARAEAARMTVSLDFDGGEDTDLREILADDSGDPLEELIDGDLRSQLRRGVADLPKREQRIIALHYQEGLTLQEIAARLHVSEARVSQLHTRAVDRLKGLLAQDTQKPSLN